MRYTQTATNSQNVSYVVVKDNIKKLKEMALESRKLKGEKIHVYDGNRAVYCD